MKTVLRLIVGFMLIIGLMWFLCHVWSGKQLHEASQGWPHIEGTLVDFSRQFPQTSVNQSARTLESLCRQLGLDIVEGLDIHAERPSQETREVLRTIRYALLDYLDTELGRQAGHVVDLPPPEIVTFLTTHEDILRNISHLLVTDDLPVWTCDITQGVAAPVPNFLGHLALHRLLLTQALYLRIHGNHTQAWLYLHASARLVESLFTRPELISQMVALSAATQLIGGMRKMMAPIPAWALRWPTHDVEQGIMTAYLTEAWMVAMIADGGVSALLEVMVMGRDHWIGRVLIHALSGISRPYIRLSGAQILSALKRVTRIRMQEGFCTDQITHLETVDEQISVWAVPTETVFFGSHWGWESLDTSWLKLYDFMVHLEGTQSILAAKSSKALSPDGRWPQSLPQGVSPCEHFIWLYTVSSDASVTFQYPKHRQTEDSALPFRNYSGTLKVPI